MLHGSLHPVKLYLQMQEWPELGGGTAGVAGPQPSSTIEQPAAASEALYAGGQRDYKATPIKPAKGEATGRSPAKTSNSPDQRHPSTPSPANAHLHSPETPVSGQTTASLSPSGTPPSAVMSQHHSPHACHKHRHATSGSSSDWAQDAAHQAQQPQPQQRMAHLAAVPSSSVQQDPVVQLVGRRSSGRVPPPGFSGPVAAPSSSAAASAGARSKVCAILALFMHSSGAWLLLAMSHDADMLRYLSGCRGTTCV